MVRSIAKQVLDADTSVIASVNTDVSSGDDVRTFATGVGASGAGAGACGVSPLLPLLSVLLFSPEEDMASMLLLLLLVGSRLPLRELFWHSIK